MDKRLWYINEAGNGSWSKVVLSHQIDTTRNNITMHISEIYNSLEVNENSTSKDFLLVQKEVKRHVKRHVKYYNLDIVISVGYKVNSDRTINFRRWSTNILKEFSKKGYIIVKKRIENGVFFDVLLQGNNNSSNL